MIWLRGDEHYIESACKKYTVTRDKRASGEIRYSAWRRVKAAPAGQPFNPPVSLGMQFKTSDEAKQACVEDSMQKQVAA
jgi:hypothetical protein